MGQYHKAVSFTSFQSLDPHPLGNGMKACGQICGGVPAAIVALLSYKPGNQPADLGHHPMVGKWAGDRIAVIGDYAEDGDIPGYVGQPLSKVYKLCGDLSPTMTDFQGTHDEQTKLVENRVKEIRTLFLECPKPYDDISCTLAGLVEEALSIRFIGSGWRVAIPVTPRAVKGADGHNHYDISIKGSPKERAEAFKYYLRMSRLPETLGSPEEAGLERWPWDRPPASLAWDNIRDEEIDIGQARVFTNLSTREFIDPMAFGEVPTTAGIMRSSSNDYGSASAVFAMLLHPEARGGGDVSSRHFSMAGRWRNGELILTSEHEGDFPATNEVKSGFTDISGIVASALSELRSR